MPEKDFYTDINLNGNKLKNSTTILIKVSGEIIPSYTPVVVIDNLAFKLDNENPLHQFSFQGFSVNGTVIGEECHIQIFGELELTGWGLSEGQQYLAGVNGAIQLQNNSLTGFTKIIGYANTSNILTIIKDSESINK